jgi:hypothetical protein
MLACQQLPCFKLNWLAALISNEALISKEIIF